MKEPKFEIIDDNTIVCYLEDNGEVYYGMAQCHPDDQDFFSARTGEHIAASRAYMAYLKDLKRIIKIEQSSLTQLRACLNSNHKIDKKSIEMQTIAKFINKLQQEKLSIEQDMREERRSLNNFLDNKNKFYRRIESLRANSNKESVENVK